MVEKSGMKTWIAAGVALLVAVAIVPALSGAASAAPVTTATTPTGNQWAYGGEGWSNGSIQFGNATIDWTGMFGWTVIVTVTPTASDVWMVEEQRTVGANLKVTLTTPVREVVYTYHGQEVDVGFANVTNTSVVYSNGVALPALGLLNASASVNSLVNESIMGTYNGHTHSAYLNVTGSGKASVSFTPSLGLIPLNLTGVNSWNSTATATPSASWTIAWTWDEQGYNGTVRSGSGMTNGNLNAVTTVMVHGYKIPVIHPFTDGKTRVGVILVVQGPFACYDAFLLIPHGLDLFGGAPEPFGSLQFGSSAISAENLYVSSAPSGPAVTAADQTFGATDSGVTAGAGPAMTPEISSSASPGTTVQGQPISVAQAQSIDHALTSSFGFGSSPGSSVASIGNGVLIALVAVVVVIAVVGTVGVIEWRSYARRKSKGGLVGGYGESWPNGVPPAAALPPSAQAPPVAPSGPESVQDPNRPA